MKEKGLTEPSISTRLAILRKTGDSDVQWLIDRIEELEKRLDVAEAAVRSFTKAYGLD
jgi:hypothetical protein